MSYEHSSKPYPNHEQSLRPQQLLGCVWLFLLLAGSMALLVWWFWPQGSGLNPEAQPRRHRPRRLLRRGEDQHRDL